MNRATSSATLRGSIGFGRKPLHPTATAMSRSPARACAVSARIGMCFVRSSAFRIRVACHPSIFGIDTSIGSLEAQTPHGSLKLEDLDSSAVVSQRLAELAATLAREGVR